MVFVIHHSRTRLKRLSSSSSSSMNQPQLYMCPFHSEAPFHLPPPYPSRLSQSTCFGCPVSYIKLTLVICFTYGSIYVSVLFSQIILPLLLPYIKLTLVTCFTYGSIYVSVLFSQIIPPLFYIGLFSISVFPLLLCMQDH